MTLFIRLPKRQYEINDLYVMALTFCIFFAVGQIIKSVFKKLEQRWEKSKHRQIPNPTGGAFEFEVSDDVELGKIILSCIADNKNYVVKDEKIIRLIFKLVKAKIKDDSLVLTPNMMRFLALNLINNDSSLITKVGNAVVSSNNKIRLLTRVVGAAMLGLVSSLAASVAYGLLIMVLFFNTTENCGYQCDDYFNHIGNDEPVRVVVEKPTSQLVIAGNDKARQVDFYTPSKTPDEVTPSDIGEIQKIKRDYKKSSKKAREVKFSDFKKNDKVLSSFNNLEEPSIPQNVCPITDASYDSIKVRID